MQEDIIKCLKKVKGENFVQTDHLITDGWLDSFSLYHLIRVLESEFCTKIPLSAIRPESFDSVESIEDIISPLLRN